MSLVDRLRSIVDSMPPDGSVTLSVAFLRGLLDAEGDSRGDGRLLTLEEAGDIVGRSPGTIRTWANSFQLEGAFKLQNRSLRVPERALHSFIERQQSGEHEARTVRLSLSFVLCVFRRPFQPHQGFS